MAQRDYLKYYFLIMIRLRILHGVSAGTLLANDFVQVKSEKAGIYYSKRVGSYEIQMKPYFPYNLRIQNFDDNRVPWILMKFLLKLEKGEIWNGEVKVFDNGRYKTLKATETLELIEELNKYSDVCKRLKMWYYKYLKGDMKF